MRRLGWLVLAALWLAPLGAAAQMPAGHPPTGGGAPPPGHGAEPADPPGMFRPPPDESEEDASIPAGTISVRLLDADNAVVPGTKVQLGIVKNSVAKGESRDHKEATTDAKGYATFSGLGLGSDVAYRISTSASGGSFAAMPFRLPDDKGMRVVVHVYAVTGDMSHEQFFESAGAMFLELKDDRLLVQQAVRIFNATKLAWVPTNTIIKLPEGFTALQSGMAMSDQGVDSVESGAKLHGTFGPGEHEVVFSWQLPYSGSKEIGFDITAPPRMGSLVVRAAAAQGMKLIVDGFPEAMNQTNDDGQRMLVSAKRVGENEPPIPKVHVTLTEIPTRGPAAEMTTALAVLALATGIYLGTRKRTAQTKAEQKSDRDRLLDELTELDRSRRAGDIGPKTYEHARREITSDIARTFAAAAKAAQATSPARTEPTRSVATKKSPERTAPRSKRS